MNYPIWELTTIGGGTLIALIAVLHVYISHLAVGGGMFIWLTDLMGYRHNSADIHAYVKRHTKFFLLLTMVFGGMSGVGIWFIISLVHPAATSKLIHLFVFGWAIEWVFFAGEIVALLVYHYYFDELGRKARLNIAFLYALFAWLSLVVIAGIVSFMLTPGDWLQTNSFWDGIFNPSYLPSVAFRSFAAAMFAGLFGYVTSVRMPSGKFRDKMIRYCSKWLFFPAIGLSLSGVWYYFAVPTTARVTTFVQNSDTGHFVTAFVLGSVLIMMLGLVLSLRAGRKLQYVATGALILVGLVWMGGFEYIREIARKPYVIYDVMYSNSILVEDVPRFNEEGVLPNAKWSATGTIDTSDVIASGKELFNLQCLSCHTVGGIRMDIKPLLEPYTSDGVRSLLTGMGKINTYMPQFIGTDDEREAMWHYLVREVKGVAAEKPQPVAGPAASIASSKSDIDSSKYVLLAWTRGRLSPIGLGVVKPNTIRLEAQLIGRGDNIGVITEDVTLSYPGQRSMELDEDTWTYFVENLIAPSSLRIDQHMGTTLPAMRPHPSSRQLIGIWAVDSDGNQLAHTSVPQTLTEFGCTNCHAGSNTTSILALHDRLSGTDLLDQALDGNSQNCLDCHSDNSTDRIGVDNLLGFSASMHGWHANYMVDTGDSACTTCHPSERTGRDSFYRGVHSIAGVTCVDCHGTMDEHSLALLKNGADKPGAARLMRHLTPSEDWTLDDIEPRQPWVNMPNCLVCHVDYEQPEEGVSAFNEWTTDPEELWSARADDAGIRCAACHGSVHALYPERSQGRGNLANLQPQQYQGKPYAIGEGDACAVCHMQEMEDPIHHDNMHRDARVRLETD